MFLPVCDLPVLSESVGNSLMTNALRIDLQAVEIDLVVNCLDGTEHILVWSLNAIFVQIETMNFSWTIGVKVDGSYVFSLMMMGLSWFQVMRHVNDLDGGCICKD